MAGVHAAMDLKILIDKLTFDFPVLCAILLGFSATERRRLFLHFLGEGEKGLERSKDNSSLFSAWKTASFL